MKEKIVLIIYCVLCNVLVGIIAPALIPTVINVVVELFNILFLPIVQLIVLIIGIMVFVAYLVKKIPYLQYLLERAMFVFVVVLLPLIGIFFVAFFLPPDFPVILAIIILAIFWIILLFLMYYAANLVPEYFKTYKTKNEVIFITVFFDKKNNEKFSKNEKNTCLSECSQALDSLVPLLHDKRLFQIIYKSCGDGSFWCEFSIVVLSTGLTTLNIAGGLPQAMHITGVFLENIGQYLSTTGRLLQGTSFRLTPGSRAALEKEGSDVSKQCLIEYHRPKCFGSKYLSDGRKNPCSGCNVLDDCRIKAGKGKSNRK